MMAITPNPEPPVVTRSSVGPATVLQRSGARPLTGCAPSQKKRKVCRCTGFEQFLVRQCRQIGGAWKLLGMLLYSVAATGGAAGEADAGQQDL